MNMNFLTRRNAKSILLHILTLLVINFVSAQSTWNQLGADIEGAMGDGKGASVSLSADGLTLATGAASGPNATLTGLVRVYTYNGSSWTQKGTDINGEADGDSFGSAISISDNGDILAIGASAKDLTSSFAPNGRVQVYEWNGSAWVQKGSNIDGVVDFENLGESVSLSGDGTRLAVGVPGKDTNGATTGGETGAVQVYEFGTDWTLLGTEISGVEDLSAFGAAVSLDQTGTTLAVGATTYTGGGSSSIGQVRTYRYNGSAWEAKGTMKSTFDGTVNKALGTSVSLSNDGNRLAIGAPTDLFEVSNIGSVQIWDYASENWTKVGADITSSLDGDTFGQRIELSGSGTHVVIGAPNNISGNTNGRTEIYTFNATDWEQVGVDLVGEASDDAFGSAVAISDDGSITASGAFGNDGGGADAGHVRVYEFGVADIIAPTVTITSSESDPTNNSPFQVTITFSEEVSGFEVGDITVGNGSAGNLQNSDNITFTADITPTSDGSATVDIAAGVAQDLAGNDNTVATQFSITFDGNSPVFTSGTTADFEEGSTAVAYTAVATDFRSVTYSLGSGNDETLFSIDGSTGAVSFLTSPDFESPTDGDENNAYVIEVIASDGLNANSTQTVTITVTNVNEAPSFTSTPITTVNEHEAYEYDITTTDPDEDAVTVSATTLPAWMSLVQPGANVSTLAGSGTEGATNGQGTAASFKFPQGVIVDVLGNVYVADNANHLIRKITAAGDVTTLAGSGTPGSANGQGAAASFNSPTGLAVDFQGNVYVADNGNHLIRKITAAGDVTTLAGSGAQGSANGQGTAASFNSPSDVALDIAGNVYVADQSNHLIRKITSAGDVSTLAGSGTEGATNGTGTAASFKFPQGVTVDGPGNVYVADNGNHLIRKITQAGEVTTLAGSGTQGATNGTGTAASFNFPLGVTVFGTGIVYVADGGNHLIRKITPAGDVTTLAGSGAQGATNGEGTAASFNVPTGVAVGPQGNVHVADQSNHLIRKIVSTDVFSLKGDPSGQIGDHAVVLSASDGNGGTTTQPFTVSVADVLAPTATITSSHSGTTNQNPITITITFSENVTGFTEEDITVSGATKSNFDDTNAPVYTIDVTPSGDGAITVDVAAGAAKDAAGNDNEVATPYTITFDGTAPSATISSTATSPSSVSPIPVTITFSEEVSGFVLEDITVENGSADNFNISNNTTYTVDITPAADGQVVVDVVGAVAQDLAGNDNTASTQFSIMSDRTAPTVTVTTDATNPTNSAFEVTITFSEEVTGFMSEDISVIAGIEELSGAASDLQTTDNIVFTATITPTVDGFISVGVSENKAEDLAGNENTTSDPSVGIDYDGTKPTASVENLEIVTNSTDPIPLTITFSEDVTGFEQDDLFLDANAVTLSNFTAVNAATYTVDATYNTNSTENVVEISILANSVTDEVGNGNDAISLTTITFDLEGPSVEIQGAPTSTADAFTLTFAFSEDVTGFEIDDITVSNGAASNLQTASASSYTATITPATDLNDGAQITINVTADVATDAGGNGNTAAMEVSVTYDPPYSGGSGTEADPYLISDEQALRQLSASSEDWSAHFKQTADISMSEAAWNPIGNLEVDFKGTYDGAHFRIDGLSNVIISEVANLFGAISKGIGLFGFITNANLKNIALTSISFNSSTNVVGGLVATATSSTIENCYVTGNIINLLDTESSKGVSGGIIGLGSNLLNNISNCFTDVEINSYTAGGIAAFALALEVSNSFALGNINGLNSGGLVGGGSFDLKIQNSYYAGKIEGEVADNFGGLIGGDLEEDDRNLITNSFWDTELSGVTTSPAGGTGLTSAEMRGFIKFNEAGWDFTLETANGSEDIWTYAAYYPLLTWQLENWKPYTVSGKILDENGNPFTAGTVRAEAFGATPVTSPIDSDGGFSLAVTSKGTFGVHNLQVIPNNANTHFTTYYGNTNRADRSKFILYNQSGIEIQMIAKSQANQLDGNGRVSGRVVSAGNGGGRIVQGRILEGDPLEGVTVFLVRTSDEEILTSVLTDANGDFEISGIPAGEYQLLLGVAGVDLNLEGSTFTMDEEGSDLAISAAVSEDGVSFAIEEVLGVEDEIEIMIYPNPVSDLLNVRVEGAAKVRLLDLSGQVVREESFTNETQIDVRVLAEGVHFIEITNDKGRSIRKLFKTN